LSITAIGGIPASDIPVIPVLLSAGNLGR